MEKQPSFITYKPASTTGPAERLAAAATAFFEPSEYKIGMFCLAYISDEGTVLFTNDFECSKTKPSVFAGTVDRGNGPEIGMEFYNCDPPAAATAAAAADAKPKRARCYNCKHAGELFKIGELNHLHCQHESLKNNTNPWESLREWWGCCDKHEPKV